MFARELWAALGESSHLLCLKLGQKEKTGLKGIGHGDPGPLLVGNETKAERDIPRSQVPESVLQETGVRRKAREISFCAPLGF